MDQNALLAKWLDKQSESQAMVENLNYKQNQKECLIKNYMVRKYASYINSDSFLYNKPLQCCTF